MTTETVLNETLLVSTRDHPGIYDAIETAKPGEPLFPLQGGDPLAPALVQMWADFSRVRAGTISAEVAGLNALAALGRAATDNPAPDKKRAGLLTKATGAEQVRWSMESYQRGEVDVEGKRARYQDDSEPEPEREEARNERAARIKIAAALHNHLAGVNDVAEAIQALGGPLADQALALFAIVPMLKRIAGEIEPRRGDERS